MIDEHARGFRPGLAVRLRVLLACVGVLAIVWTMQRPITPAGLSPEASLAHALAQRGLFADGSQVVWLSPDVGPFSLRSALVVAEKRGELPDVHFVRVRATDEGRVLDLWLLTNLTRSSSAAESQLLSFGPYAAFAVRVGNSYAAITVLDARGEPRELTRGWPLHVRVQNAITNLQDSGRPRGFGRVRYGLDDEPESLVLVVDGGHLRAELPSGSLRIDPAQGAVLEGEERVSARIAQKGQPGTITWVVDTVRNLSFVGAAPIEWLEHVVFGLTDRATRAYHDLIEKPAPQQSGAEARAALAAVATPEDKQRDALTAADPDLKWPPPPIAPVLREPLEGEGEWLPVIDDMVAQYAGAPPPFYQTFVRVDPERTYTRVFITLWDPRQIQLHVAMGTQEPISATGETGPGQVPRDPETLRRLVGAFNGGFQALHGEFGMMAEGRVYLPPKPYAATVAVHDDGRVGLGSWPGPGRSGWDEARANEQIPGDMIAMRQNLTTVVEDGAINPWKRWWWGAAPVFATEQTFIHRSGLCVTGEGYLGYFWGESMGPEELGRAMNAARCARGMHLDMNSKHTGFELYRTFAPLEVAPPLGRKLNADIEHEGRIEGGGGFTARARLAVKTMTPLRFPRYLGRDPRDFFFLTQKPVLPGPPLQLDGRGIELTSTGLPHAGFPHAFARARVERGAEGDGAEGDGGAWLVRVDLSRAVPAPLVSAADLTRALGHVVHAPPKPTGQAELPGELALYSHTVRGLRRFALGVPPKDAQIVLRGHALASAQALEGTALLAIDREGFALYVEPDAGAERWIAELLSAEGIPMMVLPVGTRLRLSVESEQVSVSGAPVGPLPGPDEPLALALLAETRPAADVMFPEVAPKPYRFWGWLQGQRVRYFPKGEPRFKAPEEAIGPAKPGATEP